MNELVIVGNGKLADTIENKFNTYSDIKTKKYKSDINYCKDSVFIHIGSGRQYVESLQKAIKHGASFIQAATEKDIKMEPPTGDKIIYLNAPNIDLNIIKLFYWLKSAKELFKGEKITITESHQEEKSSQPGTALKFCNILGISETSIVSIREPEIQRELKINNLKHHAYHKIQIGDEDSKITIETKIEGANSYVKGLAQIVSCISGLENGNYEIDELLNLNLI